MLSSDLLSYANVGQYMVEYAQFTRDNASVEAETDPASSPMQTAATDAAHPVSTRPIEAADADEHTRDQDKSNDPAQETGTAYTEAEEEAIEALEARDAEVKRHEQAHYQAAGRYGSPPNYEYQTGPDGKRYAVGGSVDIDTSEIPNDPQATLEKARVIKRAALAPEEPSAQDRTVAREADQMAARARQQISEQRTSGSANTQTPSAAERTAAPAPGAVDVDPVQQFAADMVHRNRAYGLQMNAPAEPGVAMPAPLGQPTEFSAQGLLFDQYV